MPVVNRLQMVEVAAAWKSRMAPADVVKDPPRATARMEV